MLVSYFQVLSNESAINMVDDLFQFFQKLGSRRSLTRAHTPPSFFLLDPPLVEKQESCVYTEAQGYVLLKQINDCVVLISRFVCVSSWEYN